MHEHSYSELIPQSYLFDSRVSRREDTAEVPVIQSGLRLAEVHLVERVEELAAELNGPETLRYPEALRQRQIRDVRGRTAEEIPSGAAVTARLVLDEGGRIEEPLDHVMAAAVRSCRFPDKVRAIESHSS